MALIIPNFPISQLTTFQRVRCLMEFMMTFLIFILGTAGIRMSTAINPYLSQGFVKEPCVVEFG